jgi:hypothetical protein
MKKLFSLLAMLIAVQFSYAQWTTSGHRVTTTDSVGIGTSTPHTPFEVNGAVTIQSGGVNVASIVPNVATNGAARTLRFQNTTGNSTEGFEFYNASSSPKSLMMIEQSGNVGIGTTKPTALLTVQQGNGVGFLLGADNTAQTITANTLKAGRIGIPGYANGALPTSMLMGTSDASINTLSIGGGSSFMNAATVTNFYAAANNITATGNIIASITSTGLGIGTTSPGTKLDVYNGAIRDLNNGAYSDMGGESYNNTDWEGSHLYFNRSRGTLSTPLAVRKDDCLGFFDFWGHDGTAMRRAGEILVNADASPSGGIVPGRISFATVGADGVNTSRLIINSMGNVAIGTTDPQGHTLAVNGDIIATKITVKPYGNWPDYVFKSNYSLPSLSEVKSYIDQNQHLPGMPSEQEVYKDGIDLGEIVKIQTKKIEELTLYLIKKDEQLALQQTEINQQNQRMQVLDSALKKLMIGLYKH